MRNNMKTIVIVSFVLFIAAGISACTDAGAVGKPEKHFAQFDRGDQYLYLDKITNDFMKSEPNTESEFRSFKVGFLRSNIPTKELETEFGKYIEYQMQYDWKMMLKNDSLSPVFAHPVTNLNSLRREMILVFEVQKGQSAESLTYADSYGQWGRLNIPLNPISKGNIK